MLIVPLLISGLRNTVVQRWMLQRLLNLILGIRRDSTGEVLLILSWENARKR